MDSRLEKIVLTEMSKIYDDARISACEGCISRDFHENWLTSLNKARYYKDAVPWPMKYHYCWVYPLKYQQSVIKMMFGRMSEVDILKKWVQDSTATAQFKITASILSVWCRSPARRKILFEKMLSNME
jgi:hypothetical protein